MMLPRSESGTMAYLQLLAYPFGTDRSTVRFAQDRFLWYRQAGLVRTERSLEAKLWHELTMAGRSKSTSNISPLTGIFCRDNCTSRRAEEDWKVGLVIAQAIIHGVID